MSSSWHEHGDELRTYHIEGRVNVTAPVVCCNSCVASGFVSGVIAIWQSSSELLWSLIVEESWSLAGTANIGKEQAHPYEGNKMSALIIVKVCIFFEKQTAVFLCLFKKLTRNVKGKRLCWALCNSMVLVRGNLFFLQDLDLKSLIIEAYFKGQQVYETF